MINEILELSRSLERCRMPVPTQHPWIRPFRKGEALIVRVCVVNGQVLVSDVEHRNKEDAGGLWKVEMDKHHTFPGHNLYGPLFSVDPAVADASGVLEKNLTPVEMATRLAGLVHTASPVDSDKQRTRIKEFWNHVYDFPQKELLPLLAGQDQQYAALEALIKVFESFAEFDKHAIQSFFVQVAGVAIERCGSGRLDSGAGLVRELIIGKWNKPRKRLEETYVSVFFDLADYSQVQVKEPIKIGDRRMAVFVSQRLLSAESARTGVTTGTCSLTGESGPLVTGSLPTARLPIGDTQLMSMDENAPCHNRYGPLSTSTVFPVGRRVAQRLYDVLSFVCPSNGEREGKTWILAPSGSAKPNLLIAYVEEMPNEDFENARLLGGTERTTEADFESLSAAVCGALRHKVPVAENHHLRLFVIGKAGDGPAQIVLAERLIVQVLLNAVKKWKEAADNHPPFGLRIPRGAKGESTIEEPACPFPSQIVDLVRRQWIRGGRESHELEGCKLAEVYEVFFGRERAKSAASILLEKTIQRLGPLLLGVGQADHRKWRAKEDQKAFTGEAKRVVLRTFSVLGILLFELGRKKEDYMKDSPYYVGRMFALADLLHSQYCQHVRKAESPGQLLGNAHVRIAMDNPARGLARLEERLLIYKAWADKFSGDQAGLVKWCLGEMGKVAECLAEKQLPQKMDDTARAEMLLGYLAHPEKDKGKKDSVEKEEA